MESPIQSTIARPGKRLRWIMRERVQVLQQLWTIQAYQDGRPAGVHEEWRDIPIERVERLADIPHAQLPKTVK